MADDSVANKCHAGKVGSAKFKSTYVSLDYERKPNGLYVKQWSAGPAVQLQGSNYHRCLADQIRAGQR